MEKFKIGDLVMVYGDGLYMKGKVGKIIDINFGGWCPILVAFLNDDFGGGPYEYFERELIIIGHINR